jgi:hypothetical protein
MQIFHSTYARQIIDSGQPFQQEKSINWTKQSVFSEEAKNPIWLTASGKDSWHWLQERWPGLTLPSGQGLGEAANIRPLSFVSKRRTFRGSSPGLRLALD